MSRPLVLGAVAYDPKVVTIWGGFREWLRHHGVDLDFVLYAHYERQVDDLLDGHIDVAWNSPLAWIRATRLARARDLEVSALLMRDTDRDLTSVIAVRNDSDVTTIPDLTGRSVGVGAVDSPQGRLLPLGLLRDAGLAPGVDVIEQRFNVGIGLHGDHVGGEREAAEALRRGEVEAACMLDANLLMFAREGTLPGGSVRVIAQTTPFDHCNMTSGPAADPTSVARFVDALLGMSYADSAVRRLLDLEGLTKWMPGRLAGYEQLDRAVDAEGLYGNDGEILEPEYRP